MLWYLYHEKVSVYRDGDGEWSVVFETRCRHLQDDLLCGVYEDRPEICRDFDNTTCEVNAPEGGLTFATPEEFLDYLRERRPGVYRPPGRALRAAALRLPGPRPRPEGPRRRRHAVRGLRPRLAAPGRRPRGHAASTAARTPIPSAAAWSACAATAPPATSTALWPAGASTPRWTSPPSRRADVRARRARARGPRRPLRPHQHRARCTWCASRGRRPRARDGLRRPADGGAAAPGIATARTGSTAWASAPARTCSPRPGARGALPVHAPAHPDRERRARPHAAARGLPVADPRRRARPACPTAAPTACGTCTARRRAARRRASSGSRRPSARPTTSARRRRRRLVEVLEEAGAASWARPRACGRSRAPAMEAAGLDPVARLAVQRRAGCPSSIPRARGPSSASCHAARHARLASIVASFLAHLPADAPGGLRGAGARDRAGASARPDRPSGPGRPCN